MTTAVDASSHENGSSDEDQYKLPRGNVESARLATQHFVLTTRQGYLLHPTVAAAIEYKPAPRIVDIATGTGIWAMELAERMPHATVCGLDVSDAQYPTVKYTLPPNLTLGVYDLLQDVPDHLKGQFDVVHVRLLLAAGPEVDKELFIGRFRELLCEGGWLQWDEFSWPLGKVLTSTANDNSHGGGGVDGASVKGIAKTNVPDLVALDLQPSHPCCFIMTHINAHTTVAWIRDFERVIMDSGGFDFASRFNVPVRPFLLQVETDLMKTSYGLVVQGIIQRMKKSGTWSQQSEDALNSAMNQLHQESAGKQGVRVVYNWNVCVARKR